MKIPTADLIVRIEKFGSSLQVPNKEEMYIRGWIDVCSLNNQIRDYIRLDLALQKALINRRKLKKEYKERTTK